jgi:hypothetical protein
MTRPGRTGRPRPTAGARARSATIRTLLKAQT